MHEGARSEESCETILAGNRIEGPAIVEEHASTTVLTPGDVLQVGDFGNLDVEVGAAS